MDNDMVLVFACLKAEPYIEANGVMINQMEMEFCILVLVKLLKDVLIMDKYLVAELRSCYKTEATMKEITAITEDMDKVFVITKMVNFMKDNGMQIKELAHEEK